MKITIIGGGNIGGAIAGGLAASTLMKASDLTVADPSAAALERIKGLNSAIRTSQDNAAAVEGADLIILAVKPWLAEEVSATFRDKLNFDRQCLASVVAGVSFEKLKTMLDNGKDVRPALLRLIPNTAISLRESVTFIASDGASESQLNAVVTLFKELGQTVVVSEAMMAAGTSLASCGIAFALKYLGDSIKGGVELGFDDARRARPAASQRHDAANRDRQGDHARRTDAERTRRDGRRRFQRSRPRRIAQKPLTTVQQRL